MEQFEPPKYIAGLIAAINDGAKSAQLGALAFTLVGLFLLATAFSATDEDLLLNHAIGISQLGGAQIPVVFAFGLAPTVFVAAHLYTLIRYDMLASGVRQFLADLRAMVPLEADRERCRQLLANVEFINALAMPPGSRSSSWVFRWTSVVLIAVFPVTVLLLVQISSLRLQVVVVNWIHHAGLAIDLVLLVWFFGRQSGDGDWSFWTATARRKAALCWLPAAVIVMDLAWLRVPDAESKTVPTDILAYTGFERPGWEKEPLLDRRTRVLLAIPVQPVDLVLCKHVGWGCRYLTVTNRPIVAKVWDAKIFVKLRNDKTNSQHLRSIEAASLRQRTLRFAILWGIELFNADLAEVDLQGADLRGAQLQGAELRSALLQGTRWDGAGLQGANLIGAQLDHAILSGAQLQGARLLFARLPDAKLDGAMLQGADLGSACLYGADLGSAQLQGADLQSTKLQGSLMHNSQLQGANLSAAELQGADLLGSQLQGADLRGTQLQGANLQASRLWNVVADLDTQMGLADMRAIQFGVGLTEDDKRVLLKAIPEPARAHVETALRPHDDAETLPLVGTQDGPVLIGPKRLDALRNLVDVTDDETKYESKFAGFRSRAVAAVAPELAELVEKGADIDSWRRYFARPDLDRILLSSSNEGKVKLSRDTVARLERQTSNACPRTVPAKP